MTITSMPGSILFIALPVGNNTSEEIGIVDIATVECPDILLYGTEKWVLVGRISSTTMAGCHFYAHVRHNLDGLMPGIYIYDDLNNNGRAVFDDAAINVKSLGFYAAYTKSE